MNLDKIFCAFSEKTQKHSRIYKIKDLDSKNLLYNKKQQYRVLFKILKMCIYTTI